jgi:hypothetical protein
MIAFSTFNVNIKSYDKLVTKTKPNVQILFSKLTYSELTESCHKTFSARFYDTKLSEYNNTFCWKHCLEVGC